MGFPAVPGAPEARPPSVPEGLPPERHVAGPRGGPAAGVPRRRVSPPVAPDRPSRIPLKPTPSSSDIRGARRGREKRSSRPSHCHLGRYVLRPLHWLFALSVTHWASSQEKGSRGVISSSVP